MEFLFWVLFGIIFYTYIGYGVLLILLVALKKRIIPSKANFPENFFPSVTFLVAAWNEKEWIEEKIRNSLDFAYPAEKIFFYYVTDGSDDGTDAIIREFPFPKGTHWRLFHEPERKGKIAAVDRVMSYVNTEIVVFSDTNTFVNPEAIRNIVRHYADPGVGAVAGEKRVKINQVDSAASNEGIYWQYESLLKKLDSELYSVVGAAGELFSIRKELYRSVEPDTLVEDFVMTMRIAMDGYRVVYEPDAFALEGSSASVEEELKRKIRIAAGGLQAIYRLSGVFNFLKYGLLSFQFISHRVLRWTLAPLALFLIFFVNAFLAMQGVLWYQIFWAFQIVFYVFALVGWVLERKRLKYKAFFIPYYFCMMNYAMFRGLIRLFKGKQSVLWEKAKRTK